MAAMGEMGDLFSPHQHHLNTHFTHTHTHTHTHMCMHPCTTLPTPPHQAIILNMAVKMAMTGKAEKDGRSDDEEDYEASDGEKED
jgi:hypothetical protein